MLLKNGLINMNKLEQFYIYLSVEKRYSPNTVDAYKRDLNAFQAFVKKENIDIIDELTIKSYLAFLYSKNRSKRTISRKISCIKSYFKYLNKKFNISCDFINTIKTPKKDKLLPELIYADELNKILNYEFNDDFCYRNKAIIHLLYSSGIRVSELCSITLASLDLEKRYLVVTGKGNKTRICPFSKDCKAILENYINMERNKKVSSSCNYLFINKFGDKISTRAIQYIVNNLSIKLFGTKKLHPHLFRHTYATNLLNNGADLRTVQELLGHSSLMTTQVYTHLAKEEINKIYKISHPRGETN